MTTPIDINPVEHSSDRATAKQASRNETPYSAPHSYYTYATDTATTPGQGGASATTYQAPRYGTTHVNGSSKTSGRIGGVVQVVAGSAIALVGIPLLILPGPGLLTIGGGIALAANGVRKIVKR